LVGKFLGACVSALLDDLAYIRQRGTRQPCKAAANLLDEVPRDDAVKRTPFPAPEPANSSLSIAIVGVLR
jgi:hypothetical protein